MNRKIHNDEAGYVAERKNPFSTGKVVIYRAEEQGLDVDGGKFAVVCDCHHTLVNTNNLKTAREIMKRVDFCEECMKTAALTPNNGKADNLKNK